MLPGTGQDQSVFQNQTEEGDARFLRLRAGNGDVEVWIPSHPW